tara:strand:- start:62 stop:259 length:198 start_codon:yes stop_codon:yes gene_type:complete
MLKLWMPINDLFEYNIPFRVLDFVGKTTSYLIDFDDPNHKATVKAIRSDYESRGRRLHVQVMCSI